MKKPDMECAKRIAKLIAYRIDGNQDSNVKIITDMMYFEDLIDTTEERICENCKHVKVKNCLFDNRYDHTYPTCWTPSRKY